MTAPLFLVEPGLLAGAQANDLVTLSGPEGRHAVSVRRVTAGERIDLGDGCGTVVHARATEITGRDSLVAVVEDRLDVPAPKPRVVVVQALIKGDRAEAAVATLTEVGVDVIVPWQARRAVVRWGDDRSGRGPARWAGAARAAGKQARRAWLPEVASVADEAAVEGLVRAASCAVVLHERATTPLRDIALPASGDIVLLIGPEGGVSPEEIERLSAAGAQLGLMGPTVMRASTAGTVAAAVVLSATQRWV